jgi:hypothetical protein
MPNDKLSGVISIAMYCIKMWKFIYLKNTIALCLFFRNFGAYVSDESLLYQAQSFYLLAGDLS